MVIVWLVSNIGSCGVVIVRLVVILRITDCLWCCGYIAVGGSNIRSCGVVIVWFGW